MKLFLHGEWSKRTLRKQRQYELYQGATKNKQLVVQLYLEHSKNMRQLCTIIHWKMTFCSCMLCCVYFLLPQTFLIIIVALHVLYQACPDQHYNHHHQQRHPYQYHHCGSFHHCCSNSPFLIQHYFSFPVLILSKLTASQAASQSLLWDGGHQDTCYIKWLTFLLHYTNVDLLRERVFTLSGLALSLANPFFFLVWSVETGILINTDY